ncbi:MAG: GTPase HflX [Lachnospiraceae bacterium]|nr:GTPase HflX [Lachnospiraceae bacterium]
MINTSEKKEKYIEIAVTDGYDMDAVKSSLDELARLLDTAGAESVYQLTQTMESPSPATYIGKGKIDELREFIDAFDADGVISDDELTPAQMGNLEQALNVKVIDRTMLILDIFAQHATTREGKIQVEMAQLQYKSSRLSGSAGVAMSRLGGGIGTRGPGESKLETDRRRIRDRISSLRKQLKEMEKNRENTRKSREKNQIPVFAIVGYTNAGKSTLLNALTGSSVLEEDALFATLDPTTRRMDLGDGWQILLTDTVGFISKLPHNLIDAFHSTLEEAKYADYIIHVVDSSDPSLERNMDVVYKTLNDLQITGKPILTVFNKDDIAENAHPLFDRHADLSVHISAKTGQGIDQLKKAMKKLLLSDMTQIKEVIPYTEGSRLEKLHETGHIIKEEYRPDGVYVEAFIR